MNTNDEDPGCDPDGFPETYEVTFHSLQDIIEVCPCDYPPPEMYEQSLEFAKLQAKIILTPTHRKIIVPSHEEMIGLYALERDDQLPNRKAQS